MADHSRCGLPGSSLKIRPKLPKKREKLGGPGTSWMELKYGWMKRVLTIQSVAARARILDGPATGVSGERLGARRTASPKRSPSDSQCDASSRDWYGRD